MTGLSDNWQSIALVLIPALPLTAALLGYILAATGRRWAARACAGLGGLSLAAGAALALTLLIFVQRSGEAVHFIRPWLQVPNVPRTLSQNMTLGLELPLAFLAREPQLLFALTTSLVGLAVLVFAGRERQGDARAGTFFATMTLFAGSMLLFLTADTLLIIYLAWELMGVCSYLLIAHPGTAEARRAARQAFWTTRATDFGLFFAVIILLTVFQWGTLSSIDVGGYLSAVAAAGGNPASAYPWFTAVALLALFATLGKAAQLPLSFWLADAMVAPAPVSALLHAATMVAAGPYLLIQLHRFFAVGDVPLLCATLLGGLTLLLGAVMALSAEDPKRVLAYSTVSHLGLVVLSVGVLAEEAGYYHLLAHAWFKAALFLGVGYLALVATAHFTAGTSGAGAATEHRAPTLGELAGSARRHPLVLWGVLVPAGVSLAGLFPLAGALGKEQILYALLTRFRAEPAAGYTLGSVFPLASAGWMVGAVLLILALPLTAAYITRLVAVLGWGSAEPAATEDRESPVAVAAEVQQARAGWSLPLLVAGALAVLGSVGWAAVYYAWYATPAGFKPVTAAWKWSSESAGLAAVVLGLTVLSVLIGAGLTWYMRVARPTAGAQVFREGGLAPVARFCRRGMYLREAFQLLVGRCGEFLAVVAGRADVGILDWLVLRCGWLGRVLALLARWLDDHVVDGARWWACEIWWIMKRLHARFMQTGQIQHYMFIVLLGAVALCLIALKPLGRILADILGGA